MLNNAGLRSIAHKFKKAMHVVNVNQLTCEHICELILKKSPKKKDEDHDTQHFPVHVIPRLTIDYCADQNCRHISLALCSIKIDYRQKASHRATGKKWGISIASFARIYTLIDRFHKRLSSSFELEKSKVPQKIDQKQSSRLLVKLPI